MNESDFEPEQPAAGLVVDQLSALLGEIGEGIGARQARAADLHTA
mgnify:CR=1 FL=1